MASDSLLKVIAGLVKREGRIAKEDAKKAKDALKVEAEGDEEEDEDEDPVGKPAPEKEPEEDEDNGEGDSKPSGPDPILVAQVAAIVKKEIEDEGKEKEETEIKLSGKKEKINTKPKMEQRMGKMNFKEAIRMSVTGTSLIEGYESNVLQILEDEGIKGPLGYEPFFEKGKLFVQKGQERNTQKALKNSKEINKVPSIVGEEMEVDEYLAMEAVDVDGRCVGFKEALRRLTYEKIKQMKEKEEAKTEDVEIEESNELQAIMALDDEGIQAEINKKGEVTVKKKDLKKAEAALKKSFTRGGQPKLVGEDIELTNEESKLQKEYKAFYAKMLEKFGVKSPGELDDAKKKEFFAAIEKGWKEGEGPVKEDMMPEGLNKENAASFMAAASAAKRDGKKTFKFGDPEKEYPVTIKVDIPLKKEEVEVAEGIRDFKVGDTVKFVNDDSDFLGQTGKITSLSGNGISQKATIKLDKGGKSITNVLVKVDLIKEEVELGEALKPKDKDVIQAFYDKESLEGRLLSTDGKTLEKLGMGGQTIAVWKNDKIVVTAVSDVKSTDTILNYMKKSIPKLNFDKKSWQEFFEGVEVAEGWKKGKYTIKDENGKILGTYSSGGKAKKVMDDLMQKGDYPELTVSMVEEVEVDEKKMPADAKRKQQARRKKQKAMGKKAPDAVYARGYAKRKKQTGHGAKDPKKGRKQGMKAQAGSFVPDGSVIERWKNSAFDKVRAIRSKLKENNDIAAARELKLYIEHDRQQLIPIIENVQRKIKSGTYDHAEAPKLWMYVVDNSAKKYVKEFGGNAQKDFPKELRLSVANELANEYKAEIELKGGEII
jgi:hypothetical protein